MTANILKVLQVHFWDADIEVIYLTDVGIVRKFYLFDKTMIKETESKKVRINDDADLLISAAEILSLLKEDA